MLNAMIKNGNKSFTNILIFSRDHGHRTWCMQPWSQERNQDTSKTFFVFHQYLTR